MIKYLLNFSMVSWSLGCGAGSYHQPRRMESKHPEPGLCACGWWPLPRGGAWDGEPAADLPTGALLSRTCPRERPASALVSGTFTRLWPQGLLAASCLLQTTATSCQWWAGWSGCLWTLRGLAVPPVSAPLPYSLVSPMAVDVLL